MNVTADLTGLLFMELFSVCCRQFHSTFASSTFQSGEEFCKNYSTLHNNLSHLWRSPQICSSSTVALMIWSPTNLVASVHFSDISTSKVCKTLFARSVDNLSDKSATRGERHDPWGRVGLIREGKKRKMDPGCVREGRERRFIYNSAGGGMSSRTSCILWGA